eukprot:s1653_g2.t2
MALLAASATLATGFFAMHYKVFLDLLDLPKFRQEMERWGYEQSVMKDVLKARGKEPAEYVLFLRCGAGAIALTLAAGQGFRGIILLPIWISLVAAGFSMMMVQDYRAMDAPFEPSLADTLALQRLGVLLGLCFVVWAGAKAGLLQWLREQKARRIVEGLSPGEWFEKKFKDWKEMRRVFQNGQREFSLRSQNDDSLADKVSAIELSEVQDPHNADGEGTPIYGNFKYEDWVVLSWRYELHLLSHAFPIDASDSDRLGVPEEHMEHYWRIYYHHHFEPRKLGAANLRDALKVLKEPIQLKATTSGSRILVSACDQETSIDAFVVSVEAYRRDRCRRIEAGDESAALNIPRQNKAPGPEGKATGKGVMKSAPKTPTAKPPQPSSSPAPPGGKAAPKAPVAKMPAQPQNSGGGEAKRPHPPNNGPPTKRTNPPEGHLGTVNHQVKKAAESKVLWFCGEVGGQAPSAFFLTGTNWRQGTTKSSSGKNTSKAPAEFCRWRGESQSCGGEDASKAATSAKRRATYQEVQVGGTRLVSVGPLQLFIV